MKAMKSPLGSKTNGENDVIISTSAGQAVRFNEKDVRAMGRAARGVRGVRLRPNDVVVGMDVATDSDQKLLVISMPTDMEKQQKFRISKLNIVVESA